MESILENQRSAHEEVERLEEAIVHAIIEMPKPHKERLAQEHRINKFLERIQSRSEYLLGTYEDKDGSRKAEIAAITGATEFSEFYQRLRAIKDYHRRYPNETVEPMELEFVKRDPEQEQEELDALFSGEEHHGRFLDLNGVFELYVNLKNVKKLNYQAYLAEFENLASIPRDTKLSAEYEKYLDELLEYLKGFLSRSRPLFDFTAFEAAVKADSEDSEDVNGFGESEEDQSLYCTPCAKLFSKQTVYDGHLSGKKHKKAVEVMLQAQAANGHANGNSEGKKVQQDKIKEKFKRISGKELLISKLAVEMEDIRAATKVYLDQKQTLSYEELQKHFDEEEKIEVELEASDDEDEEKIYNPLKLPLGWDGKPIPYWLYKLHGLGVEYPCEICGNYVYMGRKAFDRHFQEWRHTHGMKCLGIPNTKPFHEITLIEDAYALWEKLKTQAKMESFKADAMEEFEDAEGNVFNKKTFEDLRRQGLL
ncbi:hypothetical protein HDU76_010547 [Blyttiomyces sp. JEL0837]|nr:hypothetical protein HDU76_010547 [Blyttiomyces sp. JEL0837]